MTINVAIKGDLVKRAQRGDFDLIVHGCNCFVTMGAGIAPQINDAWLGAAGNADKQFAVGVGEARLGMFSNTLVPTLKAGRSVRIINMYTQLSTQGRRKGNMDLSYDALYKGFKTLNEMYKDETSIDKQPKVGIPLIGAGLAGGDWTAIRAIINSVTPNLNITLVEYQPEEL